MLGLKSIDIYVRHSVDLDNHFILVKKHIPLKNLVCLDV